MTTTASQFETDDVMQDSEHNKIHVYAPMDDDVSLADAREIIINKESILTTARRTLDALFDKPHAQSDQLLTLPRYPRVNITLRINGAVRGSMSGKGRTFHQQLVDGVRRSALDNRFAGPLTSSELENVTLEVWCQFNSVPILLTEREDLYCFRAGEEGVELEYADKFAYYKPSVAITSQFGTAQCLFEALSRKAGLPEDTWRTADCGLRKTSWVHISEDQAGRAQTLVALRSIPCERLSLPRLQQWVIDSANYLVANQYLDGSFCYKYNPLTNTAKRCDTNPVRASGCAYAIALAASSDQIGDPIYIESADLAARQIWQRSFALPGGGAYIADLAQDCTIGGKLGSSALLLLAMQSSSLMSSYASEADALLTAVMSRQRANGLFQCVFGNTEETESQINFFPGQALLALVIGASGGNDKCKAYYQRAFAPYRDHFREKPTTAFVGWHADVWSRAASEDKNEEYASFVFEQVDWLLQFQITTDAWPSMVGGFRRGDRLPNYSSIVFTEAVGRATLLAYQSQDPRWLQYKKAFQSGLSYCLQLGLTSSQSAFFPCPSRAIGGVVRSLSNFEVRSDVVQHAITLGLLAIEHPILFQ